MEGSTIFLVDTHSHLNSEDFSGILPEVILRAVNADVRNIMVVGADLPSSIRAMEMTGSFSGVQLYPAVGIHPHDSSDLDDKTKVLISQMAGHGSVLAVGETGLDYFYDHSPRSIQRASFQWHLELAYELGKPVIVHVRDAYSDTLDILSSMSARPPGVIHCFSGSLEDAETFLEMGYFLSFAGPVTFKKNDALREVAKRIPIDRILCETDSPYLAPHPMRGKPNEPSYVRYVYERMAAIKEMTIESFSRQIWVNSCRLFNWE